MKSWIQSLALSVLCLALLQGCASSALQEAEQLTLEGRHEQSLAVLKQADQKTPGDPRVRAALQRQRELTLSTLAYQGEAARASGQTVAAFDLLGRMEALDADHPRTQTLRTELQRSARQEKALNEARKAIGAHRTDEAEARLSEVLAESPGLPAARLLRQKINDNAGDALPTVIGATSVFNKRLTLEFRDTPVRSIFESIGRTLGVNFVFDKEVRGDAKVTIFLKEASLDEAMRIILATQQLDRKLLNDSTVFIYPNTQPKQQEHQELVTRSFYLSNADVKQAQVLVKTMAKTRDVYVDERLNLLIVRDTPEVVHLIDRLLATIDLPEPEVMLEVEVMEIGTNRLNELGLQWPETAQFGLPGSTGQVLLSQRGDFRATISSPAVIATLRGTSGATNLIANPKLRARNHEKARVQIGEKLPVFTTTSVATVGVSTSVSYIDTGLKLEVEPSVQLDNDVIMKVSLEVNNLIGQVAGPQGAIAYRVGTRNAATSLRLRDGETQILAGLINDEDRKAIQGMPGLSEMPVLGRLFGLHSDTRNKSEVVLLITPRVVRNLPIPDAAALTTAAGNYQSPGTSSIRMQPAGKVSLPMSGAGEAPAANRARPGAGDDGTAVLELSTSGQVTAGDTVSVTLRNRSTESISAELVIDTDMLQPAGLVKTNRLPVTLPPGGQQVFVLRSSVTAAGRATQVQVEGAAVNSSTGSTTPVKVEGDGAISFLAR
jgi:general secretion pathway protein D